MTREQLCTALALQPDASVHAIRARAARVATGKAEFGSSPSMRRTLVEALHLAPGCGDLAIVRVVESLLMPRPLSRRNLRGRNLHTGVVDARGARSL